MNEVIAILVGVCLAAACGLRVFLPLFIASLAANLGIGGFGGVDFQQMLGADFQWLGSTPVTIALGVATVLEVGSYYIPWLDNALDSIATPAAAVAGAFISSAMMPELMGEDLFKWMAGILIGGALASSVQSATVITRGASTATTAGVGNPAVSTAELVGALIIAVLAVLLPILAAILALVLMGYAVRTIFRFFKRRAERKRAAMAAV